MSAARIAAVAFALAVPGAAVPAAAGLDSLAGHWSGAYGRLGSIQIVHVDLARGGALTGTYSIPELAIVDELAGWRRERYDPAPVLARTRIPLLALYRS
jgi:hypothetical protein